MKKMTMDLPNLKDTLGATLDNYPQGFNFDADVIVRTFWAPYHREALANPAETYEVTFPGVAILTMSGTRHYRLDFLEPYASKRGYSEPVEGKWG